MPSGSSSHPVASGCNANPGDCGSRKLLRLYLVPALLLIVASVHTFQWFALDRSSWGSGCAFGMFSTVDYHGTRWIRAFSQRPGSARLELELDKTQFADELFRIRVLPSEQNLDRLALAIRNQSWSRAPDGDRLNPLAMPNQQADGEFIVASGTDASSTEVELGDLELEVWGISLQATKRRMFGHLVRRHRDEAATRLIHKTIRNTKNHGVR